MSFIDRILTKDQREALDDPNLTDRICLIHEDTGEVIYYEEWRNRWRTPLYSGNKYESLREIEEWLDKKHKADQKAHGKKKINRLRVHYLDTNGAVRADRKDCVVTSYAGVARSWHNDIRHQYWVSYIDGRGDRGREKVNGDRLVPVNDNTNAVVDELEAIRAERNNLLKQARQIIEELPRLEIDNLYMTPEQIAIIAKPDEVLGE